ncbi:MAG: hypothetical protein ORN57_02995, partial [Alphaproteobacteria bacterium]|nr:hypothetical protein [Alphaproteobacteria bacterium]
PSPPSPPSPQSSQVGRKKIGLLWRAEHHAEKDKMVGQEDVRSMTLAQLLPLLEEETYDIFSFGNGATRAEIEANAMAGRIYDMGGLLHDMAQTAALVATMDAVVTVDSAMAHLAPSLGVPTFLLLPLYGDWRWGVATDSVFYPRLVKIFRQQFFGDWQQPLKQVKQALRQFFS